MGPWGVGHCLDMGYAGALGASGYCHASSYCPGLAAHWCGGDSYNWGATADGSGDVLVRFGGR